MYSVLALKFSNEKRGIIARDYGVNCLNFQQLSKCNFSLWQLYLVMQTGKEKLENHQITQIFQKKHWKKPRQSVGRQGGLLFAISGQLDQTHHEVTVERLKETSELDYKAFELMNSDKIVSLSVFFQIESYVVLKHQNSFVSKLEN